MFGHSILVDAFRNSVSLIYFQHCALPSRRPLRLLFSTIHWNFFTPPSIFRAMDAASSATDGGHAHVLIGSIANGMRVETVKYVECRFFRPFRLTIVRIFVRKRAYTIKIANANAFLLGKQKYSDSAMNSLPVPPTIWLYLAFSSVFLFVFPKFAPRSIHSYYYTAAN